MDIKWSILFLILIFRINQSDADCSSLPVVENTSNNATGPGPYMSGTSIKFECIPGFNPTGSSKIYICSGDSWTNGNLKCEKIYCGRVETPENGMVKNAPTNEIGSSIIFGCKDGYDMVGSSNMVCRSDGNWQPSTPPECQIKMCGEFGSIQYGKTSQDYSSTGVKNGYGSEVKVTCDFGYVIDGPPVVMCQADGSWGKRPSCKVSSCPRYPGLDSSCIDKVSLQGNGNFLYIMCKSDVPVTKTGPKLIQCMDGEWEKKDEIMGCYCNCKVMADLTLVFLNNVDKGYLNHTLTLDWSCKGGSTKVNTEKLVCYDGNILEPVCKSSLPHSTDAPVTDKDGSTVNPPNPPTTKSPKTGYSIEVIVGLAVGILTLLIVLIGGVILYMKNRKKNSDCQKVVSYNKSNEKDAIADKSEKVRLTNGSEGEAV